MTSSLARPTFDASFVSWLETAEMEEIEGAYAENYKDAHGIKARWVYNAGYSREEFANMFVSLGLDLKAENDREEAYHLSFREQAAQLGLGEWLAANGITTTYDLMDLESRLDWQTRDPEPFPYEMLAVRAGWGEPGRMACI